jgi:hypothetical protein
MTSKALNNCIWCPSSSSSSLCLSLAKVCSCYFWPRRAKKRKIIAHILSSALFLSPTSRNHKCLDCLFVIISLDRGFYWSIILSLSLSPHRDMTNQCSQTLQLFACPNNFFSPTPPLTPHLFLFLRHRPPSVELVVNLAMLWVLALNYIPLHKSVGTNLERGFKY